VPLIAGQVSPAQLLALQPHQCINKFPLASCLTTKSALWALLDRMRSKHGTDAFAFAPQSYVLPAEAEPLRGAMAAEPRGVWIVKPVAACRGQGITLHWGSAGVPETVASRRGIASRYIHPPYLIDGRKNDLRLYVLVTCWRPLVLYLHREGLVRLAAAPYSLDDLSNVHRHLTNYAINKHAGSAGARVVGGVVVGGAHAADQAPSAVPSTAPPGLKLGLDEFHSAVPSTAPPGLKLGLDEFHNAVPSTAPPGLKLGLDEFHTRLAADVGAARAEAAWRAVEDALIKTLLAAEPTMGQAVATYVPPTGGRCFQLFGFDVMLDAALQPHVFEVNLDPSLATDTALDLRVKAAVLTDLLNLVGVAAHSDAPRAEATGAPVCGRTSAVVSVGDAEIIEAVDAEIRRAQGGGWKRLHPCASRDYSALLEPSRARLNGLPFAKLE
jgi:hypothetical protein